MKGYSILLVLCLCVFGQVHAAEQLIEIPVGSWKLTLMVGSDNRLYQLGCGKASETISVPAKLPSREKEFLPAYGNGYIAEPAVQVVHTDGNTSLDLVYENHSVEQLVSGITLTKITLKDSHYPFFVDIFFKSYAQQDVMELWTDYRHKELSGDVILYRYASAAPLIQAQSYWLTQFNGRYKHEATIEEEKLARGVKSIGTNLGVRSNYYVTPSVLLSCNGPAQEDQGEVFGFSLKWAGNFEYSFDYNWSGSVRVISGIKPLGQSYHLSPDSCLSTPALVCSYSSEGTESLSRNIHHWVDQNVVRDPDKDRPVIINNWEATHCNFDEKRLTQFFDGAKKVGAEVFLLDDGWFGNDGFARDDDKHGLGDWQVDKKKLPHGLSYLTHQANKRKLDFGIWLEPEMVNPKSNLYTDHSDWVIGQRYRESILGRNQEVLDLTRPEVFDFEKGIFQDVLGKNPKISYIKWDCNRFVTQPGSSYLSTDKQSHLMVDYTFNLYKLMDFYARTYPNVMGMLCAGGSGRVDFESLKYFHSFWPSDNTDPIERIKIQWGFGYFYPAKTLSAHVTRMGSRNLKLAVDVAMSGAFGIDLDLEKATTEECRQLAHAVEVYKSHVRPLVMHGDIYRLLSPYSSSVASWSYVSLDKKNAVVYLYQIDDQRLNHVRLKGLNPDVQYEVKELDTALTGTTHFIPIVRSGQQLMNEGIEINLTNKYDSAVIMLTQK